MNTSFTYQFIIQPPPGDTRDPVLLDINFQPLFDANPGQTVFLEFVSLSGTRQDVAGNTEIIESFAAKLIGDFAANNLPTAIVNSPRPGDSIVNFDGWVFSSGFPLDTKEDLPLMPANFQLEFSPSNIKGATLNDVITVSFTIGFRML